MGVGTKESNAKERGQIKSGEKYRSEWKEKEKKTGRNKSPLAGATCIWEYGGEHGQMMECVIDRHHQMLVTTLHHGVIIIISNIVIITIIVKIISRSIIFIIITFNDQQRKWREI